MNALVSISVSNTDHAPCSDLAHSNQQTRCIQTFALELLSNLEDICEKKFLQETFFAKISTLILTVARRIQTFISELFCFKKNVDESNIPEELLTKIHTEIVTFLNKKAFTEKTDFQQYNAFIERLISTVQAEQLPEASVKKVMQILRKQQTLLEVQLILSKGVSQVSPAQRRWSLVKKFVTSGLCTKNLSQLAAKAESKGLLFTLIPMIPHDSKTINLYPFVDIVNRLDPEFKTAGLWLTHHIQVFTFKELCRSIQEACTSIEDEIRMYDGYHILTVSKKSQEWMAQIAMRYMPQDHLPESLLPIGSIGCVDEQFSELIDVIECAKYKNFILFDDACYSGTQLTKMLGRFGHHFFISRSNKFLEPVHLTIVVGFMPDSVKLRFDKIAASFKKHNLHVSIVCKHPFNSIIDHFDNEKINDDLAVKIIQVISGFFRFDKKKLLEDGIRNSTLQTLVTTEWKRPDYVSVPLMISEGYVALHRFSDKAVKAPNNCPRMPFTNEKPFKDILPPYL